MFCGFSGTTKVKMAIISTLISGSDSRLRLWDIESGRNTLVNFETVRLQTSKPLQLATCQNSAHVFVPCMTTAKVIHPSSSFNLLNSSAAV